LPREYRGLKSVGPIVVRVRADGFEWTEVVVDWSRDEEHDVLLQRGAIIEVEVQGARPSAELSVDLRPANDSSSAIRYRLAIPSGGRARADSLPAGIYSATLNGLRSLDRVACDGCEAVVFQRGAVTVLHFFVTLSSTSLSDLRGSLQVPKAWGLDEFVLVVEGEGGVLRSVNSASMRIASKDASSTTYGWTAAGVMSGPIGFELEPISQRLASRVVAPTSEEIALVLAPPRTVRLTIRDADTGEIVSPCTIDTGRGINARKELEEGQSSFELRVPGDVLEVHLPGRSFGRTTYVGARAWWKLSESTSRLDAWVSQVGGIEVLLRESLLAACREGRASIRANAKGVASGIARRTFDTPMGQCVWVSEPGEYTVDLVETGSLRIMASNDVVVDKGRVTRFAW
jgi:hypothetical protein